MSTNNDYTKYENFIKLDGVVNIVYRTCSIFRVTILNKAVEQIIEYLKDNEILHYHLVTVNDNETELTVSFHSYEIPIPKGKPFYVTSTDTFFSGWALAENLINVCVVPCDTKDQAEKIIVYLEEERTDQKDITIHSIYPNFTSDMFVSNLSDWLQNI